MPFKNIFYLELWRQSRTICAIVIKGIIENIHVKLLINLYKWFRRTRHFKKMSTDGQRTNDARRTKTDHNSSP